MPISAVFSVSEFNEAVNYHLQLLGEVTVEGEISFLNVSHHKWLFLTLSDSTANLEVFGLVWNLPICSSLTPGIKVRILGQPSLYHKSGRFRLIAHKIIPAGEGSLRQVYEQLKQRLTSQGIFDPGRKRPLPKFPRTIALITAANSQAYQDFIKVVFARMTGLVIKFFPTAVQGEQAVSQLLSALSAANQSHSDVIVITRGGGSLEDLQAFNDEALTRAVFASNTPTICAIGHEGDVTLAELAADLRASTPSNAAELVVRDKHETISQINLLVRQLYQSTHHLIATHRHSLHHSLHLISTYTHTHHLHLNSLIHKLSYSAQQYQTTLNQFNFHLHQLTFRLDQSVTDLLSNHHHRLENLNHHLSLINPQHLLKRGYTITTTSRGHIVRSIMDVSPNQPLFSQTVDGKIISITQSTHPNET